MLRFFPLTPTRYLILVTLIQNVKCCYPRCEICFNVQLWHQEIHLSGTSGNNIDTCFNIMVSFAAWQCVACSVSVNNQKHDGKHDEITQNQDHGKAWNNVSKNQNLRKNRCTSVSPWHCHLQPQGTSPPPQTLPNTHRTTTRCPYKWLFRNCCAYVSTRRRRCVIAARYCYRPYEGRIPRRLAVCTRCPYSMNSLFVTAARMFQRTEGCAV